MELDSIYNNPNMNNSIENNRNLRASPTLGSWGNKRWKGVTSKLKISPKTTALNLYQEKQNLKSQFLKEKLQRVAKRKQNKGKEHVSTPKTNKGKRADKFNNFKRFGEDCTSTPGKVSEFKDIQKKLTPKLNRKKKIAQSGEVKSSYARNAENSQQPNTLKSIVKNSELVEQASNNEAKVGINGYKKKYQKDPKIPITQNERIFYHLSQNNQERQPLSLSKFKINQKKFFIASQYLQNSKIESLKQSKKMSRLSQLNSLSNSLRGSARNFMKSRDSHSEQKVKEWVETRQTHPYNQSKTQRNNIDSLARDAKDPFTEWKEQLKQLQVQRVNTEGNEEYKKPSYSSKFKKNFSKRASSPCLDILETKQMKFQKGNQMGISKIQLSLKNIKFDMPKTKGPKKAKNYPLSVKYTENLIRNHKKKQLDNNLVKSQIQGQSSKKLMDINPTPYNSQKISNLKQAQDKKEKSLPQTSPYQWEDLQKQGYQRISTQLLLNLTSDCDGKSSLQQITERILETEKSHLEQENFEKLQSQLMKIQSIEDLKELRHSKIQKLNEKLRSQCSYNGTQSVKINTPQDQSPKNGHLTDRELSKKSNVAKVTKVTVQNLMINADGQSDSSNIHENSLQDLNLPINPILQEKNHKPFNHAQSNHGGGFKMKMKFSNPNFIKTTPQRYLNEIKNFSSVDSFDQKSPDKEKETPMDYSSALEGSIGLEQNKNYERACRTVKKSKKPSLNPTKLYHSASQKIRKPKNQFKIRRSSRRIQSKMPFEQEILIDKSTNQKIHYLLDGYQSQKNQTSKLDKRSKLRRMSTFDKKYQIDRFNSMSLNQNKQKKKAFKKFKRQLIKNSQSQEMINSMVYKQLAEDVQQFGKNLQKTKQYVERNSKKTFSQLHKRNQVYSARNILKKAIESQNKDYLNYQRSNSVFQSQENPSMSATLPLKMKSRLNRSQFVSPKIKVENFQSARYASPESHGAKIAYRQNKNVIQSKDKTYFYPVLNGFKKNYDLVVQKKSLNYSNSQKNGAMESKVMQFIKNNLHYSQDAEFLHSLTKPVQTPSLTVKQNYSTYLDI